MKENALEETLDDDFWKDSFDRLLNKRSLLRELKVIKTNVRLSYNNDSSVEASGSNISQPVNIQGNKNEKRKPSGSISTPILINKTYGPFDCPLSPISSWRLTHINQQDAWDSSSKESSIPLRKVTRLSQQSANASTNCCEKLNYKEPLRSKSSVLSNIPHITINDDGDRADDSIIIKKTYSHISEITSDDVNVNVVLPPGKWRRSLTVWKRNQRKHESLDRNSINDRCSRYSHTVFKQESVDLQRIISSRSIRKSQIELLKICKQRTVLPFSSIYSDSALRKCRKIGEGTYGEVFLNSRENEETVLKIIPIEGDVAVNGEPQKTFEQILPEVVITTELSNLRQSKSYTTSGFVFIKHVRCLKGSYPDHLIELWNLYEKNYGSENDHPGMFQNEQLYVALEIAYGGKDLEGFIFRNAEQAYAIFLQITFSLAVAEGHLQFEHRDLHCGNVLIQPTEEKFVEYIVNDNKIQIPTRGVKVTIIDYTLSRMFFDKCYYYNDLSVDDELFSAKGDYQYDIYRMMREKLGNNWKTYDPQTNVMWLHYILTKLTSAVKYKNSRSKLHTLYIKRMKALQNTILNHNSAFDVSMEIQD